MIALIRSEVAVLAAGYLIAGWRGVLWALVIRTVLGIVLNLALGRMAAAAERLVGTGAES